MYDLVGKERDLDVFFEQTPDDVGEGFEVCGRVGVALGYGRGEVPKEGQHGEAYGMGAHVAEVGGERVAGRVACIFGE